MPHPIDRLGDRRVAPRVALRDLALHVGVVHLLAPIPDDPTQVSHVEVRRRIREHLLVLGEVAPITAGYTGDLTEARGRHLPRKGTFGDGRHRGEVPRHRHRGRGLITGLAAESSQPLLRRQCIPAIGNTAPVELGHRVGDDGVGTTRELLEGNGDLLQLAVIEAIELADECLG